MSQPNDQHPHHISSGRVAAIVFVLCAIVAAVWLAGYLPRRSREQAAESAAGEQSVVPSVTAVVVRPSAADTGFILPGSMSALSEASIYARAAGYVRKRYADIGDRVKEGQVLAEIDAPDLDQQVAQARGALAQAQQQIAQANANLIQAQSQRDLAKANMDRYTLLIAKDAVSHQDYDTQVSAYKTGAALVSAQEANVSASRANVTQAQANLDRVLALQDYKQVRAPFAGIVTARNVDVGYLISAGGGGQGSSPMAQAASSSSSNNGNEMFRVAQTGALRVYVGVPQDSAAAIVPGMPATVTVSQYPGREFPAKVTHAAGSLDPNSRTMTVEVQTPNGDGKLLPGMYASVRFHVHREAPPLLVRGDTLMNGAQGATVAVLGDSSKGAGFKTVHMQKVQVGRDFGAEVEISSGLRTGDLVVVNPGDDIKEGVTVRATVTAPAQPR